MFHNHVHIDTIHLHLTQSQVQSQRNSQGYILYSTFPSLPPTVVSSWSCLEYWAFQLVVWVRASAADLHHLSLSFTEGTIGSPTTLFFFLARSLLSHFGFFYLRRLCYGCILFFIFYAK